MSPLSSTPFVVIDLFSGGYTSTKIGHELFNLMPNPVDGRYYGYCPPEDNIDITNLGAKRGEESVSNVMVIYTQKHNGTNDREIIAFTNCATVHHPYIIPDKSLGRHFINNDGSQEDASYSIESDRLYDLRNVANKFVIRIKDHNPYMFRSQRFFKGSYPKLDKQIIKYLEGYLTASSVDEDFAEQEEIQSASLPANVSKANQREYELIDGTNGCVVKKRPELAKWVLHKSDYKCAIDKDHTTFNTNHGVPYMEGHHLIPCTPSNVQAFWERFGRNIDCPENIVCICPTCHRQIHFGDNVEKRKVIERLYDIKIEELKSIGIDISLKELLDLYLK